MKTKNVYRRKRGEGEKMKGGERETEEIKMWIVWGERERKDGVCVYRGQKIRRL